MTEPSATAAADGMATRAASLAGALARAQRGELAAFRELLHAYQDIVYALALRMLKVPEDAEELAQDVFVSAHRHLGKITSNAHLLFWLRRTVCHRAIDRLRRRPPQPPVPLDAIAEIAAADTGADPLLERCLRDLVLRLPPVPRAVVLLRYQEDLDPPEIARTLGTPLNTVKSHLKRSLALLRRRYEESAATHSAGGTP
ncbi:MAG TPA: RNA polymerase sigma factor [Steroidobacteraceae bacterium]